jgi:hypothetical protein
LWQKTNSPLGRPIEGWREGSVPPEFVEILVLLTFVFAMARTKF